MKRLLTISLTVMLCLGIAVPSWGIEAKSKTATAQSSQATPADTGAAKGTTTHKTASTQQLLEKLKRDVRESNTSNSPQYENFIDANNDGVDDRVKEKAKPAPTEPEQNKSRVKSRSSGASQAGSKPKPAKSTTDTSKSTSKKKKTP